MANKTYNSDSARELARKNKLTLKDIETNNGSNYVTIKNVKDTIEKIKKEQNREVIIINNFNMKNIINELIQIKELNKIKLIKQN